MHVYVREAVNSIITLFWQCGDWEMSSRAYDEVNTTFPRAIGGAELSLVIRDTLYEASDPKTFSLSFSLSLSLCLPLSLSISG